MKNCEIFIFSPRKNGNSAAMAGMFRRSADLAAAVDRLAEGVLSDIDS